MQRVIVYIDESGTLPDPKDKVIVLAAVVSRNPELIEKLLKKVRKKGLKKQTGELKFYTAGDKTKIAFFENFIKEKLDAFVLVVEKMGRKIPDTPQHFALLSWLLLTDVLGFYNITDAVFDRHFFLKKDQEIFNKLLLEHFNTPFDIVHVDSVQDKNVNVADMIAGAVLAIESGKDDSFFSIIEKRIISYRKLNWVEAKKKLFV